MKNIAIFNTCISGSTGKIAVGLYETLKKNKYNVDFYYGREDGRVQENYHRIGNTLNKYLHAGLSKVTGLQGFGSILPTQRVIHKLEEKETDTVYIISPHGYYINERLLWKFIAREQINTIYLMIDEYAYLGNCGYSNDCSQYLQGCKNCPRTANPISRMVKGASLVYEMKRKAYQQCRDILFVGPQYTIERAKTSPLMLKQCMQILDEAIDTDFFRPRDVSALREKLGLTQNEIVCVCVAPYSYERKGCRYFVELAKRFENNENYRFVHVGFNVDRKSVDLPKNYIPIGFINDQEELAQYYSLGDLFVFPSLLDTMPNACLEALSSGTPLLLFNTSGMPYIADESVAAFAEAGNVDQMESIVKTILKKTEETRITCREYALKRYDNKKYYQRLIELGERVR